MLPAGAKDRFEDVTGPLGCLDSPEELELYGYDGGADRHPPELVLLPRSVEEVSAIARVAHELKIPLVGRGASTGLSGGSVPCRGGVVVAFARMNRILEIDLENERAIVEPGVVNQDITEAVEGQGYCFAPDPSSRRACTIGGNVAENAGGAHSPAYGVTASHVLGMEFVLPGGAIVQTGGKQCDLPGYDLTGLLTGSEGTLALVTKVIVRLTRKPEAAKTALAIFGSIEAAVSAISKISAKAIAPAALELLDGPMLRIVEEAAHAGFPVDAAAVLLMGLEGMRERVDEQMKRLREYCVQCGAREFRVARTPEDRDLLWKGRHDAFGAVGRVSPAYLVADGVAPRTEIGALLSVIAEVRARYSLTIGTVVHAAEGHLLPVILFDPRRADEAERARAAAGEILEAAIRAGGSITGELGVGMDKLGLMGRLFNAESLAMMRALKRQFDPHGILNPGKALPAGD